MDDYTADRALRMAREIVDEYHAKRWSGGEYVGWVRICHHYPGPELMAIEVESHEVSVDGATLRECVDKLRQHYSKELKR